MVHHRSSGARTQTDLLRGSAAGPSPCRPLHAQRPDTGRSWILKAGRLRACDATSAPGAGRRGRRPADRPGRRAGASTPIPLADGGCAAVRSDGARGGHRHTTRPTLRRWPRRRRPRRRGRGGRRRPRRADRDAPGLDGVEGRRRRGGGGGDSWVVFEQLALFRGAALHGFDDGYWFGDGVWRGMRTIT